MNRTELTSFASGDGRCACWVTVPTGPGPHPAVVLIHGFGAVHEMALPAYERRFSEAGLAVISFDYRYNGSSPGEPRQLIRVALMLADVEAALTFARTLPQVDPARVALWGTSLGASHAMVTAARRPEVAALVLNCPMIDGVSAARRLGLTHIARMAWPITRDLIQSLLGRERHYLSIVGEPGEHALVTVPGARAGWYSLVPEGTTWDNRCTAAAAMDLLGYRAVRHARTVACPTLVCVSDHETLMDPAISSRAARDIPHGRAVHYPADHFEVYHPPLVDHIVHDQLDFLAEVLDLPAGA